MNFSILRSAVLNVVSGGSGAAFSIILPILLSSRITRDSLAGWVVILQCASYVPAFTLGIQSVVARQVAILGRQATGLPGTTLMTEAAKVMFVAAGVFTVFFLAVSLALGKLYPRMPLDILQQCKVGIVIFACAQSTAIPLAVVTGYYVGLHRTFPVAVNAVLGKLAMAGSVLALTNTLVSMSLAASCSFVAANAVLLWHMVTSRAKLARSEIPIKNEYQTSNRMLILECIPISLWGLATFAIYGGTSTIASILGYRDFAMYTVASGLGMLIVGLQTAAFTPLIPYIASQIGNSPNRTAPAIHRAALLSGLISAFVIVFSTFAGPLIFKIVAPSMPTGALMELSIPILIGNGIRMVGLPYANSVIGVGLQKKLISAAFIEASLTVGSALFLGNLFGAKGVVWSFSIGGIGSLILHGGVNIKRTNVALPVGSFATITFPFLIVAAASLPYIYSLGTLI